MDRLETLRHVIDEILHQHPDLEERRAGFVHLNGLSVICALLALKREMDPQLCAVMGMLHDIASYKTGDPTNHAPRSVREAQKILNEIDGFSPGEINTICTAISTHSAKDKIDGTLAELLKDADVLQHYFYDPTLVWKSSIHWQQRVNNTLVELALPPHQKGEIS